MNGLLDSYYTGYGQPQSSTLGGVAGFNVGSEVFKVQVGITGFLIAALAVLYLLHRAGNRFSVHVG